MPWNPFLIGYLKQCLWLLIIHDDPWRVRFFPSLSASLAEYQQVTSFTHVNTHSLSDLRAYFISIIFCKTASK